MTVWQNDRFEKQSKQSKIDSFFFLVPIKEWLDDPLTFTMLHIFAEINAKITGPLWRLTEHSSTINTLGQHAQSLLVFLRRVKKEPMVLFSIETPFGEFEESEAKAERTKAHLIYLEEHPPKYPQIAVDAVEAIIDKLIIYFDKELAPYLPGGVHSSLNENTQTIPRSNRQPESNFAKLDYTFKNAPNLRAAIREIRTQEAVNRVNEYVIKKPKEERERMIRAAILKAPLLEKKAAENEKDLQDALWKQLLEEQALDALARDKEEQRIVKARNDVEKWGGSWKTVAEMTQKLQTLSASDKRKSVDDNLKYHKIVLKNNAGNNKLFTMTFKGKPKPLDELVANLSILIEQIPKRNNNEEEERE